MRPRYELLSSLSISRNLDLKIQSIDRHELLDRTDIVVRVDNYYLLTKTDTELTEWQKPLNSLQGLDL
jgi:hypothetical protein